MNRKFLVTINKAEHLTAVEFLCSFFNKAAEPHVTLLHICRKKPNDMSARLMEKWQKPDEILSGRLTGEARKAIDRSLKLLESNLVTIDQVATKTVAERFGIVRDILREGEAGLYDAILLGKRASYALQWMVERTADEIAQSIIKDSKLETPLWVCPKTEGDRRNVLVAVDGSESSLRAVDHAGYILSGQEQHKIILVHVRTGTGTSSHDIFRRAEAILQDHNIRDQRLETFSTWGLSVAGTIEDIARQHRQAAVAIGLHGGSGGWLKNFNLAGKTTSSLISRLENVSIWCCP